MPSPRPAPRVGAVTHVEWLCADLQAAQAFLQRWLGWEFTAFGANFLEHAPAAGPRIGLLQAGTGDAPVRPAQAACRAYLGTDALEALLEQAAALGAEVDDRLAAGDVRLTLGGEPTFVSIDDMDSAQWNIAALGEHKLERAMVLLRRLAARWAAGCWW